MVSRSAVASPLTKSSAASDRGTYSRLAQARDEWAGAGRRPAATATAWPARASERQAASAARSSPSVTRTSTGEGDHCYGGFGGSAGSFRNRSLRPILWSTKTGTPTPYASAY